MLRAISKAPTRKLTLGQANHTVSSCVAVVETTPYKYILEQHMVCAVDLRVLRRALEVFATLGITSASITNHDLQP